MQISYHWMLSETQIWTLIRNYATIIVGNIIFKNLNLNPRKFKTCNIVDTLSFNNVIKSSTYHYNLTIKTIDMLTQLLEIFNLLEIVISIPYIFMQDSIDQISYKIPWIVYHLNFPSMYIHCLYCIVNSKSPLFPG